LRIAAAAVERAPTASYAEQAYKQLEELVVTLQFPPGSLLTEGALSERLGMGRTPVREALQRLAAEHLVVIRPRRGIMVSALNVEQQLLALEVRRELERLVAVRAARRATPEERRHLAEMADDIISSTEQGNELAFLRLDHEFDVVLLGCARNPYAAAAIAPLHAASRRFWYAHRTHMTDMRPMGVVHADVLRAVAGRDELEAAAAADRMMDFVDSFTRATLEKL
jgi:DNA-binding GntR family transcriptional regulator